MKYKPLYELECLLIIQLTITPPQYLLDLILSLSLSLSLDLSSPAVLLRNSSTDLQTNLSYSDQSESLSLVHLS